MAQAKKYAKDKVKELKDKKDTEQAEQEEAERVLGEDGDEVCRR